MAPPQTQDDGADAEVDAAILAHDAARTAYVLRNRAVRRVMGVATFTVWLAGNVLMIGAGLASDTIAHRLVDLIGLIASFNMAAMGVISMYWGVGAFDNRSMMGGGLYGSYPSYGSPLAGSPGGLSFTRPPLRPPPAEPSGMHKGGD